MSSMDGIPAGQVALVIGTGANLDAEWEEQAVQKACGRLVDAIMPFADSGTLVVARFGDWGVAEVTQVSDFMSQGRIQRPDCGKGAALSNGIYAALSRRDPSRPFYMFGVTDCDIPETEVAQTANALHSAPNTSLVVVRIGVDGQGLVQAESLDSFHQGEGDQTEVVYYQDHRGREVGADLGPHVQRKMLALLGRRPMQD
jgi:hypothetical protein